MTAVVLDGRATAKAMQAELDEEVRNFVAERGFVPTLAVVRAGEDPASVSYARTIVSTMEKRGLRAVVHALPAEVSQEEMAGLVARLSADPEVHGIMVQEPYPRGIDPAAILAALDPRKDVDGVHPENAGRLAQAEPVGRGAPGPAFFVPATPAGGMELLRRYGVEFAGKHAVVVGRSNIVGKPMAQLLLRESCTVTIAHSRTRDLPAECRRAEIVVAAVGRAEMVRGDWIAPGAVVIDVGINRIPAPTAENPGKTRLVGDVAFSEALPRAGAITPVPGGIGPMTIACLLTNTLAAACRQNGVPMPPG